MSAAAFIVAVWQIRKTQSAAESAAQAANEARDVVQSVTSISDLSQITVQMDMLGELHRNEEWTRAIDRYSSLRRLLTEARSRLPDEAHTALNLAIIRLKEMEQDANIALAQGVQISYADYNNELIDLQQSLDVIRVWLENRLSGVSSAGERQL